MTHFMEPLLLGPVADRLQWNNVFNLNDVYVYSVLCGASTLTASSMASTNWTSLNLPQFLSLVSEWRAVQPLAQDFAELEVGDGAELEQTDVFVAFRTRPPLPNEEKAAFTVPSDVNVTESAGSIQSEFCPGISVASAFPGEFYAHVPSLKVCLLDDNCRCCFMNDDLIFIVERIDFNS
jgi:hypothetical protein